MLSRFMSAIFAFSVLLCFIDADYNVSEWRTTIINPVHPGNKIPLRIHYPSTADKTLSFPLVVFNHGGDCKNTWYNYIWQNLVPRGYIVAMPGDYEHPWIWEYTYAAAQRYTLDWLRGECNANVSCPLYGMVGNRSMASGHSMGGGATFLSISNFDLGQTFIYEFDAAFTLSGCDNRYDELIDSLKHVPDNKAVFIMSGSKDCICPPDRNSDVFYADITNKNVCKFLADIRNSTHCNFEQASDIGMAECDAAEFVFCPFHDYGHIKPKITYRFVQEYMTLFVNATLQSDAINFDAVQLIQEKLEADRNCGNMTTVASSC